MKVPVSFVDDTIKVPFEKKYIRDFIKFICLGENVEQGVFSVLFVDTNTIHELNAKYLNHDYPTDVLAFPLHEPDAELEGEIYVCLETALSQAEEYGVTFENELLRLTAHGLLHLLGYNDHIKEERDGMLVKGDRYIRRFMDCSPQVINETNT